MTNTMITMITIVPIPMYMISSSLAACKQDWLIPEPDLASELNDLIAGQGSYLPPGGLPPGASGNPATRHSRPQTPPVCPCDAGTARRQVSGAVRKAGREG
jgi:hypothetical protein